MFIWVDVAKAYTSTTKVGLSSVWYLLVERGNFKKEPWNQWNPHLLSGGGIHPVELSLWQPCHLFCGYLWFPRKFTGGLLPAGFPESGRKLDEFYYILMLIVILFVRKTVETIRWLCNPPHNCLRVLLTKCAEILWREGILLRWAGYMEEMVPNGVNGRAVCTIGEQNS